MKSKVLSYFFLMSLVNFKITNLIDIWFLLVKNVRVWFFNNKYAV